MSNFKYMRKTTVLLLIIMSVIPFAAFGQKYGDGLVEKSVALVGNDVIMLSDIENEAQMMRARGYAVDFKARCGILESLLTSKLYLTQARLDSVIVSDATVEANLTSHVDEVVATLGGEKEAEAYFGKPLYQMKNEWRETIREQSIIQEMQRTVAGDIPKLTPIDIKEYVENTPEEDLPIIPTKYRIRQIGVYPDREAAAMEVREKLLSLRERVINGEKFSTLARMYSQDPGSATKGGELGMAPRSIFWPEFSDAAMALKVGQVSQVVETPDGYHIIELISREGDMFNARHILIKPTYTSKDREEAFNKLDSIRNLIVADSISFINAAKMSSEERKTATSGGLLADEYTGSSYFEKDQLKPSDYNMLRTMEVGDISEPFESVDNEGRNGNTLYKILYLEKIIPSHVATFEDDYNELIDEVNNNNAMASIEKFLDEKIKSTYIVIDPLFQKCEFEREGWIK